MAKGRKKGGASKEKGNKRESKEKYVYEENNDEDVSDAMENRSDDDLGEDIFQSKRGQTSDPKSVFAFDSTSDESDDEKMLEERLRQFERVQFRDTVASDMEDEDEPDNEDEMDDDYRPIKNKYGGIDEQHLDIVEVDEGDEPSAAVLEEQEAKMIQKRLASLVTDSDVNLELLGIPVTAEDKPEPEDALLESRTLTTSPQKLISLVDKRYPELENLITRLKDEVKSLSSKWIPLVKLLNDKSNAVIGEKVGKSALMFSRARHLVAFTYCVNALFYLRLRARHENVEGHPVTARLVSNHKLLEQLSSAEQFFMKPGKRLDLILQRHLQGADMRELVKLAEKEFSSKSAIASRRAVFNEDEEIHTGAVSVENAEEEVAETTDMKRQLTDKMEKIGGKPKSKTKRNPRVANRNRFDKALRRRKASGVREWQPPVNAYGGEMTGIRAGLRRSTKLNM